MAIKESKILVALATVPGPDMKNDIVSLKMVEQLSIDKDCISFTIPISNKDYGHKDRIYQAAIQAIHQHVKVGVDVQVHFSNKVTTSRDNADVLPEVKNIVAVASGKGGVGKSTVSVNLAYALAKTGAKVGIIDADIYGPSIPIMMGLKGRRPNVEEVDGKHKIIPIEKDGIKVLSIGFLVDERQATVWRGPMASSALKQFVTECEWGALDYLILDLPPGTGDIHLTLVQTMPITGAVIVTTPQEVALADARKGVGMFKLPQINVPVLGLVENMAWFTPAELPDNKYFIFGEGGGERLANEFELSLLGQIPLVQSIREGGDKGVPVASNDEKSTVNEAYETLAANVEAQILHRNTNFAATEVVTMTS